MSEKIDLITAGVLVAAAILCVCTGIFLGRVKRLYSATKNMAEWTQLATGIRPPPEGMPGHCPKCTEYGTLYPGPRGGAAINLICIHCGEKFVYSTALGIFDDIGRDEKLAADISRVVKLRFSP